MTESDLKDRIMRALRGVTDGYFWRQGATPYGRSGIADILGCWDGRFVAIEAKRPGAYTSPADGLRDSQWRFLRNIQSVGGLTLVTDDLDQVLSFIKENA